eukprot:CAMPEP_0202884184 /NCGR_PEP_ID=MMETSP1391-20130828/40530_1 /ASSEMBLY_ACC=CAM_ASM_000867 /TAXON_ID=1034604 /ORGANISM="Chlamydomonas leiostraca, Strain SAG 11-49" /LENGTH=318 /DNA_ID=CAMNT_0049567325 /DNA_START=131 /DNA_END=1087 /DNA_ORIENTATION=+
MQLGAISGAAFVMLLKELPSLQHFRLRTVASHLPEDLSAWESASLQSLALESMELPCRGGSGLARMPLATLKQPLQIRIVEQGYFRAEDSQLPEMDQQLPPAAFLAAARADAAALALHLQDAGQSLVRMLDYTLPDYWPPPGPDLPAILDSASPLAPVMRQLRFQTDVITSGAIGLVVASQLGQAARWLVVPWFARGTLELLRFPAARVLQVRLRSVRGADIGPGNIRQIFTTPTLPEAFEDPLSTVCKECTAITHIAVDFDAWFNIMSTAEVEQVTGAVTGRQERTLRVNDRRVTVVFGLSEAEMTRDEALNAAIRL